MVRTARGLYDQFGFKPALEGFDQVDATVQLRGGWELNGHVQRDFVDFQDSTYAGYTVGSAGGPVYQPPRTSPASGWQTQVTTPTWQQFGGFLQYRNGGW